MPEIEDSLKALQAYPDSSLPVKDINILHEFFHRSRIANMHINLALDKIEMTTHDEDINSATGILMNAQAYAYRFHEWAKNCVAMDYLPSSSEELSLVKREGNAMYKDLSDASTVIDASARKNLRSIHIPPAQEHLGAAKGAILHFLHLVELGLRDAQESGKDA